MLCTNGKQTRFPNESGLFFICQTKYPGNQCRFVRICKQTGEYVMQTDKNGQVCDSYSTKIIGDE